MSTIQRPKLREGEVVDVVSVELAGTYKLRLRFSDGMESLVDLEPFIRSSQHPQIRDYLDPIRFAGFEIRQGDLVWGDYELCFPIADLYEGKI